MVRQGAVGYAADERGLAVTPFAVLLSDAGLGYGESRRSCRLPLRLVRDQTRLPTRVMVESGLIVAMIGPFFPDCGPIWWAYPSRFI